ATAKNPFGTYAKYEIEDVVHDVIKPDGEQRTIRHGEFTKSRRDKRPQSLLSMANRPLLSIGLVVFCVFASGTATAKNPFGTYAKYEIEDVVHDVIKPVDAYYLIHTLPSFPDVWFLVEVRRVKFDPWERSMGRVSLSRGKDGDEMLEVKWESGPLKGRKESALLRRNGTMQWLKPEKGQSPHGLEAFELNSTEMPAQALELVRFLNHNSLRHAIENRKSK
ncbi:MAG: hypothetical protein AAFX06_32420, partial [Planctomycetota bacterium]